MSIFSITTDFAGQAGVKPNIIRIVCDDSFSEITTANYLLASKNQGYVFNNGDIAAVTYSTTPVTQFFTLLVTSTAITLEPMSGEVTLPVVSGNFAVFSGTNGALDDAGYSPSDATKTKVAMLNGAVTVGNLPIYVDTAGTIDDIGAGLLTGTTAVWAGGGTSNAFTVAGLTAQSAGAAVIRTSTNNVSIVKAVPSANTLTVTFSADPGANTTLDYNYTTAGTNN